MNKEAYINLIAKVGLEVAIRIIESLNAATTPEQALTALKTIKTAEQYLAEEDARRA